MSVGLPRGNNGPPYLRSGRLVLALGGTSRYFLLDYIGSVDRLCPLWHHRRTPFALTGLLVSTTVWLGLTIDKTTKNSYHDSEL